MTDSSWTEPIVVDANNPPKYPYNNVTQTDFGHSIEMDDTVGKERVRIQHGGGTFLEMQPDGTEVHKIYGDGYEIVLKDKNVMIKGQCNITVEGPCVVNIKGDNILNVDGNSTQYIKGSVVQQIEGTAKITTIGDMDLTSKEDITMSAQNVYINGDVAVRGGISSTLSISATNNITAGMQVYAKVGMVTPGYITAGSPVPLSTVPGSIWTTGWVRGQLATFGKMRSIAGLLGGDGSVSDFKRSMQDDRVLFNNHGHTGVRGGSDTSGPPNIQE